MVWGDKKARVNLRLPVETRRILDKLARQSKPSRTLSEYVRDLLIEHADQAKKKRK
ncbi:MAG: ribbon-helix-helix protein, CopG family [Planctomycetes bacterium]|nr:ribbon-helix-helix protein, CopG family [Planctomycetota bacterium]